MFSHQSLTRAHALVLRYGYSGTSVRMLAKELDSTTHEIYEVFGGKAPCILSLLQHEKTILNDFQSRTEQRNLPPRKQLKSWLDEIYEFQALDGPPPGFLCINLACQFGQGQEKLRLEIAQIHDAVIKWIASVVGRIERTKDRAGDREIAEFILASVSGSVLLAVADQDCWELRNGLSRLKEYLDNI